MQDASYLLQVPNVVAEIPPLATMPPVLLAWDRFRYPQPFRADWIIDTSAHIDHVVSLLHCHASQVYEWLPHTQGIEVPADDPTGWLKDWYAQRPQHVARKFAPEQMSYAEAYEISEYGGPFSAEEYAWLAS